jgi:threonine/homoserine/homoserine lactone efflux protein
VPEQRLMPDGASLLAFVAAALVVLLIPGPGVLYVLARSLGQGQRAGLVSAAGLSAGAFVHVVAATAGLSALLLASAAAFGVVKVLGAAYLIYLGLRALLSRRANADVELPAPRSLRRVFADGVVVSVLNPKIAVFFLAFLPHFADATRGSVPVQMFGLGLLYCALSLCTDGAYALLAGRLRRCMRGPLARGPLPQYASAAVYIGLGIGTALVDQQSR